MLVGCLAVLGCTASPAIDVQTQFYHSGEQVFQGAWFEVTYPSGFIAAPSLASSTADGYDSAEFISPDGRVSFYVFAPQWGGEPTDIALDPQRELLVAEKRAEQNGRKIHWLTICAKNGNYCRAYQDTTTQQGSVRTILGFKYRDEAARNQYRPRYLKFRDSLRLFAD
jgi:hypothetical protein